MATDECIQTKVCSQCCEALPLSAFGLLQGKSRAECKRCLTKRSQAYQRANPNKYKESQRASRARNAEKIKETSHKHYERVKDDPEWLANNRRRVAEWRAKNRERHRAYSRQWELDNPDQYRENQRRNYEENKPARREQNRRWRRENIERHRALNREDGRKRYLERDSESYAYSLILREDPCSYCGAPPPSVIDHIVPLSGGGQNAPDNLTASCLSCNSSKRSKSLLRFLVIRKRAQHG
jgi:5-methylcytosine-specific restriction endonuclease McrA